MKRWFIEVREHEDGSCTSSAHDISESFSEEIELKVFAQTFKAGLGGVDFDEAIKFSTDFVQNEGGFKTKFIYYWRVKTRLPEQKGQECAVLVRGKMNNCLVEFRDGSRYVTSRNYVRKIKNEK